MRISKRSKEIGSWSPTDGVRGHLSCTGAFGNAEDKNLNRDEFRANWHRIAPLAQSRFPELSAADLAVIGGEKEIFVGILVRRSSLTADEIESWLDRQREPFLAGGRDTGGSTSGAGA
jgi:hypothetical protein